MDGERGREGERMRERGRKRPAMFIWKYDTFVTHSWGSLKYDHGLI